MKRTFDDAELDLLAGCMDTLALALAEHDHTWTEGERAIYEEAFRLLGRSEPKFEEVGDDDPVWVTADVECNVCHTVWRARFHAAAEAKLECPGCGAQNSSLIQDSDPDGDAWKGES
jgi:hypothetical protein